MVTVACIGDTFMTPPTDLRAALARPMAIAAMIELGPDSFGDKDNPHCVCVDGHIDMIAVMESALTTAIDELTKLGWVIVPVEPTQQMLDAYPSRTIPAKAQRILMYRAMIRAAGWTIEPVVMLPGGE